MADPARNLFILELDYVNLEVEEVNQVQTVAFWTEFIASIVGIVLSIVAIVFSILVDRRSSSISEHTIQSLQKIESAVERLSSDTRDLIKAGWDKMIGNVDGAAASPTSEASAKEVAAGIAAELRSELTTLSSGAGSQNEQPQVRIDRLEKYLKNLEASLIAQLGPITTETQVGTRFGRLLETVRGLTRPAYTILRAIRRAHLTQREYKLLSEGQFGSAVLELRRRGLLVPVVHRTSRGSEPCYYFPSGIANTINDVLEVLPDPPPNLQDKVARELVSIGYSSGHNKLTDMHGDL